MVSPAIILQKIVEMLPYDAVPHPSLQSIEVGGSPMPIRLRGLVREKLCVGIRSHYGSTETGAVASAPFLVLGDDPGIDPAWSGPIRDMRAQGLAAGVAGHGLATARMLLVSETAGAFGGLAIGLNGVVTAILVPLLATFFAP